MANNAVKNSFSVHLSSRRGRANENRRLWFQERGSFAFSRSLSSLRRSKIDGNELKSRLERRGGRCEREEMKAGGGNQRGGRAHESWCHWVFFVSSHIRPVYENVGLLCASRSGVLQLFFFCFHETFVLQLLLFIRLANEKNIPSSQCSDYFPKDKKDMIYYYGTLC